MRAALTALTDELKRLKATGVKSVAVSEESLVLLRKAVGTQRAAVVEARAPRATAANGPTRSTSSPASTFPPPAAASAPATTFTRPAPAPAAPEPAATPPAPALPPAPVVTLPAGDKATRWAWLRERALNDPVCVAHVRPGKKGVLGVGSLDAKIMFIGEAPGPEEEVVGEPFVGPAGLLLTKMIAGMGLKREQVYIASLMNWRPQVPTAPGMEQTGNRAPTPEEIAYCMPYLRAQIAIVQPALLVALGATVAAGLLGAGSFKALGDIRSQWKQFDGSPVMVTYHPSYILKSASNRSKRAIWEDLLMVMERAGLPISDKQRGYFLDK